MSDDRSQAARPKTLAVLAALTLLATATWSALFAAEMLQTGPLLTREAAVDYAMQVGAVFFATHAAALLVTVLTTILFAGLYTVVREHRPVLAAGAIVFVPVYAVLGLLASLSQLAVVPRLAGIVQGSGGPLAEIALAMAVQQWPGSAAAAVAVLSYAVLGLPAILFGGLLVGQRRMLAVGGALLTLSGLASMVGLVGLVARSGALGHVTFAGIVLYLLALIPLTGGFLAQARQPPEEPEEDRWSWWSGDPDRDRPEGP